MMRRAPNPTMLDLRFSTPASWLDAVFADFDGFLLDHAACERKAAATGMSFVVRYPDRPPLIEPMIEFAKEELDHFHKVYRVIERRGLRLADDYKDPYVNALRSRVRSGGEELLLDRLLVAGVIEARGCERLFLVAEALAGREPELEPLYGDLARAESRHHGLFLRLARRLFDADAVDARAAELLDFEAELVRRLPHRAAVH
jgi:tRNA 2-(methylsulfanyl)-N6-isopentenyladenosine37 hydroxylase